MCARICIEVNQIVCEIKPKVRHASIIIKTVLADSYCLNDPLRHGISEKKHVRSVRIVPVNAFDLDSLLCEVREGKLCIEDILCHANSKHCDQWAFGNNVV